MHIRIAVVIDDFGEGNVCAQESSLLALNGVSLRQHKQLNRGKSLHFVAVLEPLVDRRADQLGHCLSLNDGQDCRS